MILPLSLLAAVWIFASVLLSSSGVAGDKLLAAPVPVWTTELESSLGADNAVVLYKDRVLATTTDGALHVLDANDGSLYYTFTATGVNSAIGASGIVVKEDTAFYAVHDSSGEFSVVIAVNLLDGKAEWRVGVTGLVVGAPAVGRNAVYVTLNAEGYAQVSVIAPDETGAASIISAHPPDTRIPAAGPPTVRTLNNLDVVVFAETGDMTSDEQGSVYVLMQIDSSNFGFQDGDPLEYALQKFSDSTLFTATRPVVSESLDIYLAQQGGAFFAWRETDTIQLGIAGEDQSVPPTWRRFLAKDKELPGQPVAADPALSKNESVLATASADRQVYCISSEGNLLWKSKLGDKVKSSPVLSEVGDEFDHTVYFMEVTGVLHQFRLFAEDGPENWQASCEVTNATCEANVEADFAVSDTGNVLFFGDTSGRLVSIEVAAHESDAPTVSPTITPMPVMAKPTSAPSNMTDEPTEEPTLDPTSFPTGFLSQPENGTIVTTDTDDGREDAGLFDGPEEVEKDVGENPATPDDASKEDTNSENEGDRGEVNDSVGDLKNSEQELSLIDKVSELMDETYFPMLAGAAAGAFFVLVCCIAAILCRRRRKRLKRRRKAKNEAKEELKLRGAVYKNQVPKLSEEELDDVITTTPSVSRNTRGAQVDTPETCEGSDTERDDTSGSNKGDEELGDVGYEAVANSEPLISVKRGRDNLGRHIQRLDRSKRMSRERSSTPLQNQPVTIHEHVTMDDGEVSTLDGDGGSLTSLQSIGRPLSPQFSHTFDENSRAGTPISTTTALDEPGKIRTTVALPEEITRAESPAMMSDIVSEDGSLYCDESTFSLNRTDSRPFTQRNNDAPDDESSLLSGLTQYMIGMVAPRASAPSDSDLNRELSHAGVSVRQSRPQAGGYGSRAQEGESVFTSNTAATPPRGSLSKNRNTPPKTLLPQVKSYEDEDDLPAPSNSDTGVPEPDDAWNSFLTDLERAEESFVSGGRRNSPPPPPPPPRSRKKTPRRLV